MSASAEALLFGLHGQLLRSLSASAGVHFQGISQAARSLRRRGVIRNQMANKLAKIDYAYNLVRHITEISVSDFCKSLEKELSTTMAAQASNEALAPAICSQLPKDPSGDTGTSDKDADVTCTGVPCPAFQEIGVNGLHEMTYPGSALTSVRIGHNPESGIELHDYVNTAFAALEQTVAHAFDSSTGVLQRRLAEATDTIKQLQSRLDHLEMR